MKFVCVSALLLALARGTPAQNSSVKALQEQVRVHPEDAELRYRLGLALHAIGDEAEAEPELREALNAMPNSAPAHNTLGIVLFGLGNPKAALAEFRTAAALAPKDPNVHFNLAEALARTGQTGSAMEEIRLASLLAPGDGNLARVVKAAENALAPAESTIKVDVRQVLVPVVITDNDGHHVSGLTQADFRILEDGAEQKITAFNVETSGIASAGIPEESRPGTKTQPQAKTAAAAAVRRTYMICIDTLHSSFNNFTSVRDALTKLFREEHSSDSQYIVIALGAVPEIVLNTTPDPNAVLAALQNKKFQTMFLHGQTGGIKTEMDRYKRDLNELRVTCDLGQSGDELSQIKCDAGKQRLPQQGQQVAELDRQLTVGFLRQFRGLVTQLARARDRRTIVLVSDGFQVVPGREAFDLLTAYFPDLQRWGLQRPERLQGEFEPILQLAAKSNITIDTIDSRGLYGQTSFGADQHGVDVKVDGAVGRVERAVALDEGNTLMEVAEATGGTAFHDSNNLLSGLQRAFADGRNYYTLGYTSTNSNQDGKFRAISVQVRDKNLRVNAKRGYWAELAAQ